MSGAVDTDVSLVIENLRDFGSLRLRYFEILRRIFRRIPSGHRLRPDFCIRRRSGRRLRPDSVSAVVLCLPARPGGPVIRRLSCRAVLTPLDVVDAV